MALLPDAVQGARYLVRYISWVDGDGDPMNLTDATLTGKKQSLETGTVTELDGVLTVVEPGTAGVFTWKYGENDVAAAGEFLIQITATFPGNLTDRTMLEEWTVHRAL